MKNRMPRKKPPTLATIHKGLRPFQTRVGLDRHRNPIYRTDFVITANLSARHPDHGLTPLQHRAAKAARR